MAALTAALAVVTLISPSVIPQYLATIGSPPLYWRSATLGTWLRTLWGADKHWLQFLPTIIALIGLVAWAFGYKGAWNWKSLTPGLLLVSTISASYGWGFDQVTLLPVVMSLIFNLAKLTSSQRRLLLGLYLLTQVGLVIQTQLRIDSSFTFWFPLVLAILYGLQHRMLHSPRSQPIKMSQQ